jgi:hypothetical protein
LIEQNPDINTPNCEADELVAEIRSDITAVRQNTAIYNPKNFSGRADAIDFIDFHIIDRIEGLLPTSNSAKQLSSLKKSTENLKFQFEQIDNSLFKTLRAGIEAGRYRGEAFKKMVSEYFGYFTDNDQSIVGYDNLDAFINGLLLTKPLPNETLDRAPEMVFYQQTPARIIFELAEKADFKTDDVFYDIGSGLGHVPILINLLSGIIAKGVEFEPAYCDYAAASVAEFNLSDVQFINTDAREADHSDGTVFFMYTPFEGKMLEDILEQLRVVSETRSIKLFTYGPCTFEVARQDWLSGEAYGNNDIYQLSTFKSCIWK